MIEALDLRGLWPSPLAAGAIAEFERTVSDRLAAAFVPKPGPERHEQVLALKTQARRAWDRNDLPAFTGAALAVHRIRALNPAYVRRLAWALLTQDRFEEAVPLFAIVQEDDHLRWFDEARALAGAGRLAEADEAAALCAARLASAPPEPDLLAAVKALERRPSALDLAAGWTAARAAIRAQLQAGNHDEAADGLKAALRRRSDLLAEAVQAAGEPEARDWRQLRRRACACILLGLGVRAADRLAAGWPAGEGAPAGAMQEAAPLFAAAASAAPAPRQPELLRTFARLAGDGAERGFADLALKVLTADAAWPELIAAARPSPAVTAAVGVMLARAGRLEPAVVLFGEHASGKRGLASRVELAVCQSRTTAGIGLRIAPRPGPRRVFDLFPYNGEIEQLKIKLHEMAPWVERFVLVESAMTFSGRPKPLRFDGATRAEVAPFLAKISHVAIDRFPDHLASAWARELYQRDQAIGALEGLCDPDDLVLLSDVDEVIDRRVVDGFEGEAALLAMSLHRFFLNYRLAGEERRTASVYRARHLERWAPSLLRMLLGPWLWNGRIGGAGWHLTSMGAAEDIARKLSSYAHQEHDRPDSEAYYGAVLERLRAGELEPGWERCALEDLPAYVQENRARLARLLL